MIDGARVSEGRASAPGPSCEARTQVSFEPPPREELTIIEPSRIATRVSPPGTILSSEP